MPLLQVQAGSTSVSCNVFVRDSSSGVGAGLAAVAPAGGSLLTGTKLYYSFTGTNASAGVAVSLSVLAAVNSAWSSAGIVTLDGTNMIGWVRIDLPNAALASSSGRMVSFLLFGGTNMAATAFTVELTAVNNQSATAFITGVNSLAPPTHWNTDVVQSGDAFGRLGVAGEGLTNLGDTRIANLNATVSSRAVPGDAMALTSGERTTLVTAIWGALTSALTTAGSIGKFLVDSLTGNTPQTGDAYLALTGAQAEPGQGAPAVNASPLVKISWLFKAFRNKVTQTSTTFSLFDDAGSTVDTKASVSDDAVTFTRSELTSGP